MDAAFKVLMAILPELLKAIFSLVARRPGDDPYMLAAEAAARAAERLRFGGEADDTEPPPEMP